MVWSCCSVPAVCQLGNMHTANGSRQHPSTAGSNGTATCAAGKLCVRACTQHTMPPRNPAAPCLPCCRASNSCWRMEMMRSAMPFSSTCQAEARVEREAGD